MLRLLADHGVDWVLTGSTVLAIYGADVTPNDLDVTPALDAGNLARLAEALRTAEAIPAFTPGWRDDFTIDSCRSWRPEPASEEQLDYLFVTRLGMLDVPMRLCGSFSELMPKATWVDIGHIPVAVCDPAEVLSRLEGRSRAKDAPRAASYEALRDHPTDLLPTGVDRLLQRLG